MTGEPVTTNDRHSVNVTLDAVTYDTLVRVAEDEDRTLSAQARRVLRRWAEDVVAGDHEDD